MPSSDPLTSHLLSVQPAQFTQATQTPFLKAAATNELPKSLLEKWLANDLLYMRAYIKLAGYLLQVIDLPATPATPEDGNETQKDSIEHRFVDWLVDALVNIRREERFFADVAKKYNLNISLASNTNTSKVDESLKNDGLKRFEVVVNDLTSQDGKGKQLQQVLPWLEGAVLFWATEKVYLTAWRWAREQAGGVSESAKGEVVDVLKTEFIPNWTNEEFVVFVETLGKIVDEGVIEAVGGDEEMWTEVVQRADRVWERVMDAEAAFWPEV